MDTRNRTVGITRLAWFVALYVASGAAFAVFTYGLRAVVAP
jgi:hypothetical protein